jgi:hypothetical protein
VANILMFTFNLPLWSGTHALMSTRIKAILEVIDVPAFQIAYSEMMLWIIMIGGFASMGTDDHEWFIQLLAQSCRAAGISGTDELALSLTEFLWSEFYLGPIFDEFWDDVAVARAVMEAGNQIDLDSV